MLWALVLAGCFLGGRVESTGDEAVSGLRLVLAGRPETAAVTDADGYFALELPDSTTGAVLVEFWRGDRFLAAHTVRCDRPRTIPLFGEEFRLNPVRVEALPLEIRFDDEAVRVEALDGAAVREASTALPSISEAIQALPGVSAVGRDGYTSAPAIRGMARDRSLLLLEGMRLSSDRGVGPSASFIDPFLVGDLEVIRGTSGVAYGSGAIGGAILVDLESPPDTLACAARLAGSTNGDGRSAAVRAGGPIGDGWRAGAGGFARGQDDYRFPSGDGLDAGDAVNSGLGSRGGNLVLVRETDRWTLRAALIATDADDVGRPTTADRRLDTIEDEDHVLASFRLFHEDSAGRLDAALGFHRPRTVNRGDRMNAAGETVQRTLTDNDSNDGSASFRLERRRGPDTWLAGVDGFGRWDVDAVERRDDDPADAGSPVVRTALVTDAARADLGAYGGWRRAVRRTGEALVTGRLDWASRRADERPSVSWLAPSVDARLVVPIDARWMVLAGVGHAFRAPRIQELYFAGDRPGGSRLANPDLNPERAWSAEAGVRWGDGPWGAAAALWGILGDDFIVQLPVDAAGDTLRHENVTRARLFGAETSVRWSPKGGRADVELAYAFTHGEDQDGRPLPDVPPGELTATLRGRFLGAESDPRLAARLVLRAGGAKSPPPEGIEERWWSGLLGSGDVGGDEVGHPGFARWDLGVTARPAPWARLDVSVTNLLDSRHIDRAEADAFPQPGRSLAVEFTVSTP